MTARNARTASRRFLVAALGVGALVLASDAPAQDLRSPAITAPKLNAKIGSRVYYLRWQGVRGARTYLLRVRERESSTWWINQPVRGTSYAFRPASHDALGARFQMYVYACRGNGTGCGDPSQVSAYVLGPPVVLSSPSNGYTFSNPSRRPQFNWQPYTGFKPSSGGGGVTYTLTFAGNGASPQSFTTQSTSFQPPDTINPAFQNPVRWSVRACRGYNCSSSGGTRTLNLTGSSFDELSGYIEFDSPPNGVTVDVGSELRWKKKAGAASYSLCLNMFSSGCRIIRRDIGTPIGTTGTMRYTLTASDLDAKPPFGDYYFRGKTMYWGIQACTEGNTSCVGTPSHRYVQVAPAPADGGGTIPTVSFGQHLYPRIASSSCNGCHAGGNLYPQRPDRPAVCAASRACGASTIPFSTSISAATMLSRFECLKACSQQVQYSQARGKVYVVPGNPSQSGLHHKAQESTAGAFGADVTIDEVTKPVRDWIEIWIEQGANP